MAKRPDEQIEAEAHTIPPDPFDPASLRVDPQSEATLGVEKPIVHLRVGYDPAAAKAADMAVKDLLKTVFKLD
jgi:hypothetical protein